MVIFIKNNPCNSRNKGKSYFFFFSSYLVSPFHFSGQMGIHANSLGVWGSCKRLSLGEEVHWPGCWHVDLVVVTRLHFQRCWLGRKPGLFFSQGDIRGHTLILGQGSAHGRRGYKAFTQQTFTPAFPCLTFTSALTEVAAEFKMFDWYLRRGQWTVWLFENVNTRSFATFACDINNKVQSFNNLRRNITIIILSAMVLLKTMAG